VELQYEEGFFTNSTFSRWADSPGQIVIIKKYPIMRIVRGI